MILPTPCKPSIGAFAAAASAAFLCLVSTAWVHAAEGYSPQLAPIQITPEHRQLIGLKLTTVEEKEIDDRVDTTASIAPDEQLQAYVQTRFAGWIEKVFANQTYQYVRRGEPLFTIYSPDLVSTEEEYLIAVRARQRVQDSKVEGVATGASSLIDAALERLRLWGVPQREIEQLERTGKVRRALEIDAPISGYVVERNALPGMYVQPDTRVFSITDLSRVWAYAAVFQNDIGKVKIGDATTLTVDAYPNENFDGRVDFIWPQVDPMTRAIKVRCEFNNRDTKLMPDMFAHISLRLPLGHQLVVPNTAVLRTGTRNVVFVDRGDGYLMPVEVELGSRADDDFIVKKGLSAGQKVVSSANFLIDSESQLQAALGAYVPPPPGAGGAGGQAVMASTSATAEMTTDPNPPYRGNNKIRIVLHDAAGKPITGADVSVTFFMAAMPAMGMAALRTEAKAADQGNGLYEATAKLDSGGTWQVTIVASKDGRQVAAKQVSVTAGGGM